MNKTLLVVLAVVGVVFAVVVAGVLTYVSYANYGNRAEKGLEAMWQNEQNVLSTYTQKVMEVAQIPTMMKDDVKELMVATMSGRYGNDGSKATMQWLQEHNISVDPSLYTKIQQIIEAGRDEFKFAQTRLIDAKRVYETNLDNVWEGWWLEMAGYPKVDLAKYKVIIDAKTKETFDTGVSAPLKLR